MSWTEQADTDSTYYSAIPGGTIWDSGNTKWDVRGNVESTIWDVTDPTYTEETAASNTWVEE